MTSSHRPIIAALASLAIAWPALSAMSGHWEVNLVRSGGSKIATVTGATQDAAWTACQTRLSAQAASSTAYLCQTPKFVATITADQPPPTGIDCVVSAWSAWSACSNGRQTRTRTVSTPASNGGAACPALTESQTCGIVTPPPTGATFTDLASAPACAKVTVYPAKTITDASGAGIPTHAGRCIEATPSTAAAQFAAAQCGDVLYLHAGTYTNVDGGNPWYRDSSFGTVKRCTQAQPLAIVAYPGEAPVISATSGHGPFNLGTEGHAEGAASWLTIAGLDIRAAADCASAGGNTQAGSSTPETGATNIRFVGNTCTLTATTENTMTGAVSVQGDGWYIRGNKFRDPSNRTVINNNHGVYIQNGADNVVVQDNDFQMHVGHVVQIHQDGTSMQYDNLLVKDNWIHGSSYNDMRGIAMINVKSTSTLRIEGNRIEHQGQGGWGCVNVYFGGVTIDGLDCRDSQGGVQVNGQQNGSETNSNGTRKVTITNSKICPVSGYPRLGAENGANVSQIVETSPKSCP